MACKDCLFRMPFGKYRGWPLYNIPASYLNWLGNQWGIKEPLASSLRHVLVGGCYEEDYESYGDRGKVLYTRR